jgi:hypothetical protein
MPRLLTPSADAANNEKEERDQEDESDMWASDTIGIPGRDYPFPGEPKS